MGEAERGERAGSYISGLGKVVDGVLLAKIKKAQLQGEGENLNLEMMNGGLELRREMLASQGSDSRIEVHKFECF